MTRPYGVMSLLCEGRGCAHQSKDGQNEPCDTQPIGELHVLALHANATGKADQGIGAVAGVKCECAPGGSGSNSDSTSRRPGLTPRGCAATLLRLIFEGAHRCRVVR